MSEIASHAWGVGETRGAAPVASGGHETGDVVSVIGRNEAYQGLLAFRGEARVDGDFRGDIPRMPRCCQGGGDELLMRAGAAQGGRCRFERKSRACIVSKSGYGQR